MEKEQNLSHWEQWAATYGNQLRATTKCASIKRLEIDSLLRRIREVPGLESGVGLEVGCGNGFNGFVLAESCPKLRYVGLDFSPTMIANVSNDLATGGPGSHSIKDRLAFGVLDARKLAAPLSNDNIGFQHVGTQIAPLLPIKQFDFVFTNRMLINLASSEEQLEVMRRISTVVRPGGLFLMLENDPVSHGQLNQLRKTFSLEPRTVASYNIFIDQAKVIEPFRREMDLVRVDHVSALHDLMLYAVAPSLANGEIQYDSPLMKSLTDAVIAIRDQGLREPEGFGQNILWVWKKN